jgi:branched-chain amino acid transport system ATP-binding protein
VASEVDTTALTPAPLPRSGRGGVSAQAAPALELINVRKAFGRTEIIRGVSLSIAAGERHAIIGPNGAGKSTLFNLISGRFPVSSGTIRLNGQDITRKKPYEINRLGLSRSFQITNIFHRLTVFENLRCSVLWSLGYRYSFWHNLNKLADAEERAEDILRRIGLRRRRNTAAGLLTYAEQRALEVGITIAGGANVILLDEPTSGMSRSETANAVALIREVTQGKTLVMVEHDMSVVFGLADIVSVVVYGEVIASGPPAEIRANAKVKEAYLGQHADAA